MDELFLVGKRGVSSSRVWNKGQGRGLVGGNRRTVFGQKSRIKEILGLGARGREGLWWVEI